MNEQGELEYHLDYHFLPILFYNYVEKEVFRLNKHSY